MKRALVVVDVQNDFCEGGSLAVAGGARVAADVSAMLHASCEGLPGAPEYTAVVATRDHHVDPGSHWSGTPDFVDSWPVHCRVGTEGEQFHPHLDTDPIDEVFLKGEHHAAYSGFEGHAADGTGLADWLRARDITDVDVCGIATDYCVRATVLDAVAAGFGVRVLTSLVAGVAADSTYAAMAEMRDAGVAVVDG